MKRAILTILVLMITLSYVVAKGVKSQTIVFINGEKFYIHTVDNGETLYSLSMLYYVEESDIIKNNSSIQERGLQSGESIKIPLKDEWSIKRPSERKIRKDFNSHTVVKGETLYSISRQHELSVAVIIEDNPDIDPSNLALGQRVLIRKSEVGKSSEEERTEEIEEYKETMNKVAPEGYQYHIVAPKETLYSLLRDSQMSQKEFHEVNDLEGSELQAGSIILLRSMNPAQEDEGEEMGSRDLLAKKPRVIEFKPLRSSDTLNVSLLLPLSTTSGSAMPIFEEFYQGFLMGIEELKQKGRNINITLFNTRRDSATVSQIIHDEAFLRSNLIVGPVYENLLPEVVEFAERSSIPVVSPLATLENTNSGVVFQMSPIAEHKYDKIGGLLADSVQVTLIYTDKTDADYEAEVKALLGGKPFNTHYYKYEHPSVVADRAKAAERYNRKPVHSPSDLAPLIQGDSTATIIIMPDNETDVDRILSALASAEISLIGRSQKVNEFAVLYNPKWNRYNNIDRAMLFKDRVVSFSSYHAKRDNVIIKRFDSNYVKEFNELPSLYSYRGYDVAKIFGEGLYTDIEYNMEGRTFSPLQTTYRFQKMRDSQSRGNQNWMRANYNNNFTITVE